MKNGIAFTFTKDYEQYAKSLTNSVLKNSPNTHIFACCVNFKWDYPLSDKIKIYRYDHNCETKKKIKNVNQISHCILDNKLNKDIYTTNEKVYACHLRFQFSLDILSRFSEIDNLFIVDCDFIVRQPIDSLFNDFQSTILIHDLKDFVHEDGMLIKNNETGRSFLKFIIDKIKENPYFWDQDTYAIKSAYENIDANYGTLPLEYKDYTLNDSSPVWSGDGIIKHLERFKLELKNYN